VKQKCILIVTWADKQMNTSIWPQNLLMLAFIMVGPFKKGICKGKKSWKLKI